MGCPTPSPEKTRNLPTIERPQCNLSRFFMKPIRLKSAVALLMGAIGLVVCLAMGPAVAAEPVFPPGIRVGMTPLVGLSRAKSFVGFETEDGGVKVLVTELPGECYGEGSTAFKANQHGSGGGRA